MALLFLACFGGFLDWSSGLCGLKVAGLFWVLSLGLIRGLKRRGEEKRMYGGGWD